jgi:hypothetical protein
MSVVGGTVRGVGRTVSRVATATTAAAGAVGGAAVNGVVGGVKGAAEGVQSGISTGSKSTPAAAVAIGALGVAGIVEWPLLLAIGGGALLLRRIADRPQVTKVSAPPVKAKLTTVPTVAEPEKEAAPEKAAAPRKTTAKTPAKKTAGRRAGSTELRSTN